jgi:hypothetical protein
VSQSPLTRGCADHFADVYSLAYKLFCAAYAANHIAFPDVMLDYVVHRF